MSPIPLLICYIYVGLNETYHMFQTLNIYTSRNMKINIFELRLYDYMWKRKRHILMIHALIHLPFKHTTCRLSDVEKCKKIIQTLNSNFNLAFLIGVFKSSYDNVLRWMPHDLTDDQSTLVQVMAWCRQATSHYLNQCWPKSPPPYGVTRPQWVKGTRGSKLKFYFHCDNCYQIRTLWDISVTALSGRSLVCIHARTF